MTPELQEDIEKVLDWAEDEPEVWFVGPVYEVFLLKCL